MPTFTTDMLLQLGVGGIFAYLIIKEVLNFLSKKRNGNGHSNGASGEKSVDYWKTEIAAAVATALTLRAMPLLEDIKDAQKSDLEIIRERFHVVNGALAQITIQLEVLKARMKIVE